MLPRLAPISSGLFMLTNRPIDIIWAELTHSKKNQKNLLYRNPHPTTDDYYIKSICPSGGHGRGHRLALILYLARALGATALVPWDFLVPSREVRRYKTGPRLDTYR